MATQAWQMPDVDAEKYQSVTKQGGARSEITRHVLPFTTGVSVAFSSTPAAKHASDATFRSSPVCPN